MEEVDESGIVMTGMTGNDDGRETMPVIIFRDLRDDEDLIQVRKSQAQFHITSEVNNPENIESDSDEEGTNRSEGTRSRMNCRVI